MTEAATLYAPLLLERFALRGAPARLNVVRTGMGPARAAQAAQARAAGGATGAVVVAGVGGALTAGPAPGDLVVACDVHTAGGQLPVACPSAPLLAAALRRRGLRVHVGPIVSTPRLGPATGSASTTAVAVDMESAWLAPAGAPFAVIRAIVDTPDRPLWRLGTAARGVSALRALRRAVPALDEWASATGTRELVLASPRSFCAGVDRAIDIVRRALSRYGPPVYVRRQVVHNAHVVRELAALGAVFVSEVDEVPEGAVVILAAHGVAPTVRAHAAARGLTVIDATCPLVAKVHSEVRRYAGRGSTVFLIGHGDHEEVEGTVGEAPGNVVVVENVAQAASVMASDPGRVAYAMQTTLAVDEAEAVADVLRRRFPALRGPRRDDICYATSNRQQAVTAIARGCDLVLVVGSANSSNSCRLVEVAEREGVRAHLVDDLEQVDLRWLAGARRVGITAGASAPPYLVEDLVQCLAGLGPVTVREAETAREDIRFTLPIEVS